MRKTAKESSPHQRFRNSGKAAWVGFKDSGRAVSRILSARPLRQGQGENHLSERPVPETRLAPWSGPLRGLLFGLAPDGVFPASAITREAVGSYPAFSPLPPTHSFQRRYVFCGTIRRKAFRLSSRVYLNRHRLELRGIAPCGVRTFLPGLAPGAILRPSGIAYSLPEWRSIARGLGIPKASVGGPIQVSVRTP